MGVPFSLPGLPRLESLTSDRIYTKHFVGKNVDDFEKFHIAFVNICKEINSLLPGKHFEVSEVDAKKFHEEWTQKWKGKEGDEKKREFFDFVTEKIKESKTSNTSMIITGAVAPAASIYIKKAAENVPQIKKYRVNLIPNFLFVPSCTLLALLAVRSLNAKSKT